MSMSREPGSMTGEFLKSGSAFVLLAAVVVMTAGVVGSALIMSTALRQSIESMTTALNYFAINSNKFNAQSRLFSLGDGNAIAVATVTSPSFKKTYYYYYIDSDTKEASRIDADLGGLRP